MVLVVGIGMVQVVYNFGRGDNKFRQSRSFAGWGAKKFKRGRDSR